MSKSTNVTTVAAILVTLLCMASSQAPAGSPMGISAGAPSTFGPVAGGPSTTGSDCMSVLLNVSDCLGYVNQGSTEKVPDKNCCPELAGLVDSNPICLCQLLAGGASSYGITIDISRALALPGICKVETPPVSTCAVLGYPVMSPMAPMSSPMSLPPGVQPPALPASPESGKGGNGAAAIGKPPPAISVILATAILLLTLFF